MTEKDINKSQVAKREEEILKFWQDKKIFEKSLEGKSGDFVFYDGPPYATGTPHYGHLLASTLKDVIPRYQTMRGKRVLRRWGWDCHGLPIENLIEKELGLKTKKDIENLGIVTFNEKARESVLRYADEWKRVIPRLGRFVDMERDYKTMDPSFMESGWWVFKTLWDKGLVYEGYKSMHLCPRCGTTLANFEVNQGYKDITDISVYVKFEILNSKSETKEYLLAWTTTPWTLPGNAALAVNTGTNYVRIKIGEENYILAKERLTDVLKEKEFEIVEEFSGEKLIGKKYKTLFDYYITEGEVFGADFVTTEDGTGIVHIAPAFGEDDMKLGEANKLPFIQHVDMEGKMKPEAKDFAGLDVKPKDDHQSTDILIIKYLAAKNLLFDKKKIVHSYPHCWRCETPLLNYAASSWFIKVTELKEKMLKHNASVKWVPEHIKDGRFGKWLEGARDWAVSRSRFWGTPLPVWRKASGEVVVIGSVEDLRKHVKKSGNRYLVMRHGHGENNATGIISSKQNSGAKLTERGVKETQEAAKKLAGEKIDLIFSSPFTRGKETSEIVAKEIGYPLDKIIFDERIEEIHTGEFDGKTVGEYHDFFSTYIEMMWKRPEGGENLADLRRRAMAFMYELETKYQNKTILISTHEYVTWMLWSGAFGWTNEQTIANKPEDFIKNSEVRELSFVSLPHNEQFELDLHRPYIDDLELVDESGEKMIRVPEVFDVWYDSGSMPYGQAHYPFENKEWFDHNFPANFIGEGLDQTRGWFYVLTVLSVALFDKPAFQNVIVNGLILAEDGQKMSKRLKNYPEIEPTLDKYGADALRLYLLASPAMRGDDLNFSEKGLGEVLRRVIMRLENVLAFYELYKGEASGDEKDLGECKHVLDRWILNRLAQLGQEVTAGLDNYTLDLAARPFDLFVDDLSVWYLRRSRERFKGDDVQDKADAIRVLGHVLHKLSKVLAPFTPFLAETIWQKVKILSDEESVHLSNWPTAREFDQTILAMMIETRRLVSLALEARTKAGIKVRQPLASLKIKQSLAEEFLALIRDEVNVKEIIFVDNLPTEVELDLTITPELKQEGELRELIREIQDLRKEKGLKPGDVVQTTLPSVYQNFPTVLLEDLKKATKSSAIHFAEVNAPEIVV